MTITKSIFGKAPDGTEVELYSITNQKGMRADVMTYGASLVNLFVPDQEGKLTDVTLGYDSMEPYTVNTDNFGATIGPNCNRIGGASFMLDGKKIQLSVNDGENNLHTDEKLGISKKVWRAQETQDGLVLTVESPDKEAGLPGNRTYRLTYTLTEENELKLHYEVQTDQNTILNLTNHAYFNLDGHDQGLIHDHTLWIHAGAYTPLLAGGIPVGTIVPVKGTALDFTTEKKIGRDIDGDDPQTKLVGGYDHNFVLDHYDGSMQLAARLRSERSGRNMEIYTNLPGLQIYTGNFIKKQTAKGGAVYERRMGVAMETQFFPDTPNHPEFPSTVFGPERKYDYTTVYKFF